VELDNHNRRSFIKGGDRICVFCRRRVDVVNNVFVKHSGKWGAPRCTGSGQTPGPVGGHARR
jgi:hypothetical protein